MKQMIAITMLVLLFAGGVIVQATGIPGAIFLSEDEDEIETSLNFVKIDLDPNTIKAKSGEWAYYTVTVTDFHGGLVSQNAGNEKIEWLVNSKEIISVDELVNVVDEPVVNELPFYEYFLEFKGKGIDNYFVVSKPLISYEKKGTVATMNEMQVNPEEKTSNGVVVYLMAGETKKITLMVKSEKVGANPFLVVAKNKKDSMDYVEGKLVVYEESFERLYFNGEGVAIDHDETGHIVKLFISEQEDGRFKSEIFIDGKDYQLSGYREGDNFIFYSSYSNSVKLNLELEEYKYFDVLAGKLYYEGKAFDLVARSLNIKSVLWKSVLDGKVEVESIIPLGTK